MTNNTLYIIEVNLKSFALFVNFMSLKWYVNMIVYLNRCSHSWRKHGQNIDLWTADVSICLQYLFQKHTSIDISGFRSVGLPTG